MSDKVDIAQIKRDADIVEVIGRFVTLKRDGIHWVAPCPFHNEQTSSFKVTPKIKKFKCFGCGKGGDVIDFLTLQGRTLPEAIKEISDPNNTAAIGHGVITKTESLKKEAAEPTWKQVVPAVRMDGMHTHYKYGQPSMFWEYLDANGDLVGCVCRFDLPEGKQVLPLIYATNGKSLKWTYKGFEKPRILFNLDKIVAKPTAAVLVVEGEKTAIAAQNLYPNTIVSTWMGGAQGVKHADWSVLKGRVVILWPDNDAPGFNAMHDVHDQIQNFVQNVKWVLNPKDAEKGWDLADSDWTPQDAKKYSSTNIIDYPGREFEYEKKTAQNEMTWNIGVLEKEPSVKEKKASAKAKVEEKEEGKIKLSSSLPPPDQTDPDGLQLMGTEYFRMLGAQKEGNGMIYYFYAFNTKTVIGLSPSGMTKNNLMQLAPLNWWRNNYFDSKNPNAFQVDSAANYLINYSSNNMGTFSEKWLRGRGAWMDDKRVVVHAGDKLFIDGIETPLSKYKSKFIYEIGEPLGFTVINPIVNAGSAKLVELLKMLNWDRPINSYLLAGWCVVAPICGALNWRPHIWLTGGAGTGKSWVFMKIVRPLLGETGLAVQGETSEAGLRQTLGHDALPVVFDEAEGEDRKSQDRMQSVLSLMRASSANDGGIMAKGSAGGSAKTYRIRSCFAFASIAVQVAQQSDRTRVTILGLMKANGEQAEQKWKTLQARYDEVVTEEFCTGLRARTISMLPTILANTKTFSNAAAAVIGEQRAGDQIGVLLAGAYSLVSDKIINYEDAVKWVEEKDWSEERGLGSTRDEIALISFLLEHVVRIETQAATVERSVGELVLIAMKLVSAEWSIQPAQADDRLKRVGMRVIEDYLYISNSDANILKILTGSPWAKNHNKILMRIEGAEDVKSMRFAAGVASRAVRIHKDILFKDFIPEIIEKPLTPIEDLSKEVAASTDAYSEDLPF